MPSSPRTPTRRRKSSTRSSQSIELPFKSQSPQSNLYTPDRSSHSRKSSLYSIPSPSTPRPATSHSRNGDFESSSGFGSVLDLGNGLGSLADELAQAYSDEEEGETGEDVSGNQVGEIGYSRNGHMEEEEEGTMSEHRGNLQHGMPSSQIAQSTYNTATPKQPASSKHRRQQSRYNRSIGSDHSDLEEPEGFPPSVIAQISAIESLAVEATATNDSEADAVIERVAESLKDLGSQSGIENGITRYVVSYGNFLYP